MINKMLFLILFFAGSVFAESKAVVKDGEIRILDANGQKSASISLSTTSKIVKRTLPLNGNTLFKIREQTDKRAFTSKNGQYIGIFENVRAASTFDEKGIEHKEMYDPVILGSKFILMDVNNNILFEYQFPEGWGSGTLSDVISNNGETTAVFTGDAWQRGNPETEVYIFNKKGEIIMIIPNKGLNFYPENIKISPNGKYVAIAGLKNMKSNATMFINTNNNKYWEIDKYNVVYSISNSGQAELDTREGLTPVQNIDLTQYLGK